MGLIITYTATKILVFIGHPATVVHLKLCILQIYNKIASSEGLSPLFSCATPVCRYCYVKRLQWLTAVNHEWIHTEVSTLFIVCPTWRPTVTSVKMFTGERCETHPLCVNYRFLVWMHGRCTDAMHAAASISSVIRVDIMVVLEVRWSKKCFV